MMDVYRNTVKRLSIMSVFALIVMFVAAPQAFSQTCKHYVEMRDSFGDGWNGAYMTVKVNGIAVLTNITLSTGAGPLFREFFAGPGDVVTTEYTPGSWASEPEYYILDADRDVVASSGLNNTVPQNISVTLAQNTCEIKKCQYKITMYDDFGDGWNGCYLQIYINNVLKHNNVGITSYSSGPEDFYFTVENGDEIKFTFVIGSWEEECEYYVYDSRNNKIYEDGLNGTVPRAKNTVIGYGACSFDVGVYTAVLGYANNYWARRIAPDQHPVHATLEDFDGSKPRYAKAVYKIGSAPVDSTDGVAEAFDLTWKGKFAEIEFSQTINTLMLGPSPDVYVGVFVPYETDLTKNVYRAAKQEVFDEKVMGYEDFEVWDAANMLIGPSLTNSMGWTTADMDGGDVWQSFDLFGPTMLFHPGATDDWIFAPAALLEEAASYRVQGNLFAAAPNTTFELAFGTAPNPASMTTFATFSNINIGAPTSFATLAGGYAPYFNTPPMTGDYYIGIHLKAGGVLIDWIKLDENPSPPPKIGFGLPSADISTFVDDEGASIDLTAIYKQPGKITKTYAVATTTDIYGVNGDFLWDVESTDSWISITKETPDPTLQGYNFTPPRPRQFQTFTMTIDPSGLAPGLHTGTLRFYGTLFNDDFLPPNNGLIATNEIYEVRVNLRIVTAGTKNGPSQLTATLPGPFTPAGSPYTFVEQNTGLPLATLNVTNGQINSFTVHCFPNQLPSNLARKMYVMRYWQIEYTGSGWMADITFPYADQEAAMVMDRMQLRGIRQPVPNGMWEDPIMGTTSVSNPANNSVTVMNLDENNVMGNIALAHPYMIFTKNGRELPQSFGLEQNYPNPFNPSTTISFDVAEERHVRVAVYNSLGAEVAVLVDEVLPAGSYSRTFDATGLPSGTYVYRMMAGDFVQTQRMTLSK